jgi:hypothetical protein
VAEGKRHGDPTSIVHCSGRGQLRDAPASGLPVPKCALHQGLRIAPKGPFDERQSISRNPRRRSADVSIVTLFLHICGETFVWLPCPACRSGVRSLFYWRFAVCDACECVIEIDVARC